QGHEKNQQRRGKHPRGVRHIERGRVGSGCDRRRQEQDEKQAFFAQTGIQRFHARTPLSIVMTDQWSDSPARTRCPVPTTAPWKKAYLNEAPTRCAWRQGHAEKAQTTAW